MQHFYWLLVSSFAAFAEQSGPPPSNEGRYIRLGIMADKGKDVDTDLGDVDRDSGFGGTIAMGFGVDAPNVRAEIELGHRKFKLDEFLVNDPVNTTTLMGNIHVLLGENKSARPYFGAGFGIAHIKSRLLGDSVKDTVPAYQALAGVEINASEEMNVRIGYRYFGVKGGNYGGVDARFATHNFEIGFIVRI